MVLYSILTTQAPAHIGSVKLGGTREVLGGSSATQSRYTTIRVFSVPIHKQDRETRKDIPVLSLRTNTH